MLSFYHYDLYENEFDEHKISFFFIFLFLIFIILCYIDEIRDRYITRSNF